MSDYDRCLIGGLAGVQDQGELFEVLSSARIEDGDIGRTRYGCFDCVLKCVIEYPDLSGSIEETGVTIEAEKECVSPDAKQHIEQIRTRFQEAGSIRHY